MYIIQESKNSSQNLLPAKSDIQDGLFKLILYSNLDRLTVNEQEVSFIPRLKLTGKGVRDSILFPDENDKLNSFISKNSFKKGQEEIIKKLAFEAENNKNLKIEICSNS